MRVWCVPRSHLVEGTATGELRPQIPLRASSRASTGRELRPGPRSPTTAARYGHQRVGPAFAGRLDRSQVRPAGTTHGGASLPAQHRSGSSASPVTPQLPGRMRWGMGVRRSCASRIRRLRRPGRRLAGPLLMPHPRVERRRHVECAHPQAEALLDGMQHPCTGRICCSDRKDGDDGPGRRTGTTDRHSSPRRRKGTPNQTTDRQNGHRSGPDGPSQGVIVTQRRLHKRGNSGPAGPRAQRGLFVGETGPWEAYFPNERAPL